MQTGYFENIFIMYIVINFTILPLSIHLNDYQYMSLNILLSLIMENSYNTIIKTSVVIFAFSAAASQANDLNVDQEQYVEATNEPIIVANKFTFQSKILGNKRTFYVRLPKNYSQSNQEYPVLYSTDGDRKMLRIASVVHDLSTSAKRIPPMIVVGVANDGTRRENLSLLPSSTQFLKFITDELKPYIKNKYRTNGENLLVGSSAGGQFTVRALLEAPDEFDTYIAISPSLYYNDYHLVKKAKKLALSNKQLEKSLYISLGNEGMVMGVDEFAFNLAKHPISKLKWSFNKAEAESHGSIAMKQTYNALQHYYKDWAPIHYKNITDFEENGGLFALKNKYHNSATAVIPLSELNKIADLYFYANHYQEGITLALLNIENHPESSIARYYLGSYYEDLKDFSNALIYYKKGLVIANKNQEIKIIKRFERVIDKLSSK